MTTYRVIPQVDFDRAVQKITALGVGRIPAENIVMSLWKASIDLELNFKQLIEKSTAGGKLTVEQSVLDHINASLPDTIRYNTKTAKPTTSIASREL